MMVLQPLAEPVVVDGVTMNSQPVPVLNQQTGEEIWTRPSSTFFFIPLKYWSYVIGAVGVLNIGLAATASTEFHT